MSRIPLATTLKTRTGAPSTKDARQVNSYVEIKGDQSAVRKRPAAQGGISVGTGTAQGGIGFSIGGTPYFIGFWGDTLKPYTGSGTTWNAATNYLIGDHVSVNFVDYWALNNNVNSQPPSANWSRNYVPARAPLTASPSGTRVTVSISSSHVFTPPSTDLYTRSYITTAYGTSTVLDSGSGTLTNIGPISNVITQTMNNYIYTSAEVASGVTGGTISPPTPGYDYYLISGVITLTWNGSFYVQSGIWTALPY